MFPSLILVCLLVSVFVLASSDDFEEEFEFEQDPIDSRLDTVTHIPEPEQQDPADENVQKYYYVEDNRPIHQKYGLEIGASIILAAFILNFYRGRVANEKIARNWYQIFLTFRIKQYYMLFKGQFAKAQLDESGLIFKEYEHVFKYYGTGRRYCQGLLFSLRVDFCFSLF